MSFNPNLTTRALDACVVMTDLEPDDILALYLLREQLAAFGSRLLVIVGESSASKVELATVILRLLGVEAAMVLQGEVSDKEYPSTMYGAFGVSSEYKPRFRESIMTKVDAFLVAVAAPLFIIMKPPHELWVIKSEYLARATVVMYGGFNFRALSREELGTLTYMFNTLFFESIVYESFHATGAANALTHANTSLFKYMHEQANSSPFWRGLRSAVDAWNGSIIADCLETVSRLSREMIVDFKAGDWAKLHSKKRRIEDRNWKVVASIVDADGQQMVFADCAMASVLSSTDAVPGVRGHLAFSGDGYTIAEADADGRVFFVKGMDFATALARMTAQAKAT